MTNVLGQKFIQRGFFDHSKEIFWVQRARQGAVDFKRNHFPSRRRDATVTRLQNDS